MSGKILEKSEKFDKAIEKAKGRLGELIKIKKGEYIYFITVIKANETGNEVFPYIKRNIKRTRTKRNLKKNQLIALYKEFAKEDRQLAENGITEYSNCLLKEDKK